MKLQFLSQELPPDELLRRLPSCYSAEFDACIDEYKSNRPAAEMSPICRQYHELYRTTDATVWQAAIESMPYCSAPAEKSKNPSLWLLGAGAIGLFVGMLIQ
jgi:hypothetical protein